jgi:hypothetical protein
MLCSLITERELLMRFRQSLTSADNGPHRGIASLTHYIKQEQKLDRIDKRVDPNIAASVLMASITVLQNKTDYCRIVLWVHASPRQAHRRSALRHICRAWQMPRDMQIVTFR